jgi:A/G-specific adenine glycosylase
MQNRHKVTIAFPPEDFQVVLLGWYDSERRDLPWRAKPGMKTGPYRVWLSEIMLQQTGVKTVIPYFEAFVQKWPSVSALAEAPLGDVLAAWAGLGYYSRARNLHACAKIVARDGFPRDEAGLRELPGVGAYTAAAIAAIAFDKPAAAVDGNAERVIARLFAVEDPLPPAKPRLRALAAALVPRSRPGDYAQAMMDLGATVCMPRAPACGACPVAGFCAAHASGEPARYPLRLPKAARPLRFGDAFVIVKDEHILLRRRPEKGLLGGMMEVPCTDWAPAGAASPVAAHWRQAGAVRHTFTHFHLEMRVLAGSCTQSLLTANRFGGEWASLSKLAEMALPTVMKKAIAAGVKVLDIHVPNLRRYHGPAPDKPV